jgi:16S rRNA (cytidine1402-2'-O)-methyltransferase
MNEYKVLDHYIHELISGKMICLISDAGTPLISDPGNLLIDKCIENEIKIETLPGATAFVPALVNSGFDLSQFVFLGFPPHKKGRQTFIKNISNENRTIVIYESPYRVVKFLEEYKEWIGDERLLSISREISKKFEETKRGNASDLIEHFKKTPPKGEFVVVIASK